MYYSWLTVLDTDGLGQGKLRTWFATKPPCKPNGTQGCRSIHECCSGRCKVDKKECPTPEQQHGPIWECDVYESHCEEVESSTAGAMF